MGGTHNKLVVVALVAACASPGAHAQRALADLSIEELAELEITSVSRRPEPLSDAAASIFVITGEQIRRAGVRTLPEALRLAPNLQVARINASQYAISARGFNNSVGNKLLVLIDGRTVYTPLFSGVFWDQQDVMLEDVERIEVISGPGATLWGLNAVNGVINVITRPAAETQGTLVSLGGGRDRASAARYGSALGERGHFRLYAKTREEDHTRLTGGAPVPDGWELSQAGFRADWDGFTLQGDAYEGGSDDRGVVLGFPLGQVAVSGMNLLGRWTRRLAGGSDLRVQAYVDQAKREDVVLFQPDAEIFDIEAQHGIPLGAHRLVYGGGYRYGRDFVQDGILAGMRPQGREMEWANVFVQDEIRLAPTLAFTAGLKLEHNEFTHLEHLPSARLAWKATPDSLVWASAARAVRAPARFDRDVISPLFGGVLGGPRFVSEVARVYELGYRAQATRALSWSASAFRHEWDRLRSGTPLPVELQNRLEGPVYGIEGWTSWQAAPRWTLSGGFTTLRKHLELEPGSTDPVGADNVTLGNDPEYQWMLRSSATLGAGHEIDAMVRRVGKLPTPAVPAYTAFDLRYGWRATPSLELAAKLENLFDHSHAEFLTSDLPGSEFGRALFLSATWRH